MLMESKGKKILIADDEPDILEIIQYNLTKEGYEVITAKDGDEAIGKASLGECESPDLWGDKSFQAWVWGVDIQQQAVDRFEQLYHQVRYSQVRARCFDLTIF